MDVSACGFQGATAARPLHTMPWRPVAARLVVGDATEPSQCRWRRFFFKRASSDGGSCVGGGRACPLRRLTTVAGLCAASAACGALRAAVGEPHPGPAPTAVHRRRRHPAANVTLPGAQPGFHITRGGAHARGDLTHRPFEAGIPQRLHLQIRPADPCITGLPCLAPVHVMTLASSVPRGRSPTFVTRLSLHSRDRQNGGGEPRHRGRGGPRRQNTANPLHTHDQRNTVNDCISLQDLTRERGTPPNALHTHP